MIHKLTRRSLVLSALLAMPFVLSGCSKDAEGKDDKKTIVIGVVAKSQTNSVFKVAHKGAQQAAKDLGAKLGVNIEVRILTPSDEDPQKQARAIEQLARDGAHGITVACSDASTCGNAINKAIDLGASVMCFDSDAPKSKRLYFFGTNDIECGKQLADELAKAMGEKGTYAILAGNQTAPNLANRRKGVIEGMKKYPNMKLLDTFYHDEVPEKAGAKVRQAQSTNPEIKGWAFIGGWPLFAPKALHWKPGEVKVCSVDAMPEQLTYLESGHVEVLLAQDCYAWGYESVRILVDKALNNKEPATTTINPPLTPVRKADVAEWKKKWANWLK